MFWIWIVTLIWAVIATLLLIRNPLPCPDRGHRAFGVASKEAQKVIVAILRDAGMPLRFRFRSGPSEHALLWDNMTDIHFVDSGASPLPGNGISLAVKDPLQAAARAIERLKAAGFSVQQLEWGMAPELLTVLTSDAFSSWALVFRRHILRMPPMVIVKDAD